MSEQPRESGFGDWPGPAQFIAGFIAWAFGALIAIVGAVLIVTAIFVTTMKSSKEK